MDNKDVQKNILDLRYQTESQKISAIFVICTVGILAFLGTFIWYQERIYFGLGISLAVIIMGILFYLIIKKRMNQILRDIANLA